ncbi:MAG: Hpt domain-containing protein [Synergistaceae bacterium]|jgi:HPt (histidine-containing phosphotransfer) domain-containing protein|nr:Hpt domain-containing protein [Synergistaceae bacterium]
MDENAIKEYLDADKALERIRGNAKLFKLLLSTFLKDTPAQFAQLKGEIEANDRVAASKLVHTVKGVAANLSMMKLYELSPALEALLKTDSDTAESFANYNSVYEKTVEAVNAYLANLEKP